MSDDIVVRFSHSLSADEVMRRLREGFDELQSRYSGILKLTDVEWSERQVIFTVSALGQTVRGDVQIEAAYVEIRVTLPLMLRMFTKRIKSLVQDNGVKLLT